MKDGADLGARVTELVLRYLASAPDRAEPVVRFTAPAELEAAFRAAGADLPLGPAQPPLSDGALLAAVETTLRYSVRTQDPRFFNQNFAGAGRVGDDVGGVQHVQPGGVPAGAGSVGGAARGVVPRAGADAAARAGVVVVADGQ